MTVVVAAIGEYERNEDKQPEDAYHEAGEGDERAPECDGGSGSYKAHNVFPELDDAAYLTWGYNFLHRELGLRTSSLEFRPQLRRLYDIPLDRRFQRTIRSPAGYRRDAGCQTPR